MSMHFENGRWEGVGRHKQNRESNGEKQERGERQKGRRTTGNEGVTSAAFHAILGQSEKTGKATWWAQNRILLKMSSSVK